MSKLHFTYISIFLVLTASSFAFFDADISEQLAISSLFILLLGIPHGALDHALVLKSTRIPKPVFYLIYLGLIALNIALWFYKPLLGLLLFLVISAYHFGQSQFSNLAESRMSRILYLAWGTSILSGLILYNIQDITYLNIYLVEFDLGITDAFANLLYYMLISSSALTIFVLVASIRLKNLSIERLGIELIILALIHFSFYVLPLIIGFTLYFVILHSMKVMQDEYKFLSASYTDFGVKKFIKLISPYSAVSIVACLCIVYASFSSILNLSIPFILLVLLSAITLPHSIVMEQFYKSFEKP